MSAITNERLKLSASFLNTVGGGLVVTGGIAPSVGFLLGVIRAPGWAVFAIVAVCLFLGFALHFAGRFLLRRLTP